MSIVNLSRRELLGSSSGLLLGFVLGCRHELPEDNTIGLGAAPSDADNSRLNAWIEIASTGVVTLRMGASEMGQGVFTSLPMLLADELDVDWQAVRVESAPAAKEYRHANVDYPGESQLTGGSLSVRGYWVKLREAGAAARAMLVEAAARRWDVDPATCKTENSVVTCGDKRATYAELAVEASKLKPPKSPKIKDPSELRLLGTSPPRLDLPSKVDGSALFGVDVNVEGMVYATVVVCPHHGGKLVSMDDTETRKLAGILDVFPLEGYEAVAVVANSTWQAFNGASALVVTWDPGEGAGIDDASVGERLKAAMENDAKEVEKRGEEPGGFTLDATYEVPYLEHAPIEPLNATARVQADRVDIWAPTQAQQVVQNQASRLTGVPKDKVFVHTTFLGGGFGRKSFWDYTNQAVLISQHIGKPVKMTWTRETCFARGYYRPRMMCRFQAKLGADGLPSDWRATMAGQNILAGFLPPFMLSTDLAAEPVVDGVRHMPYAVPNLRVAYAPVTLPIPIGWWRSVQGSHNGFFRESFIDECAAAAGQDPIAYRQKLLADEPRSLRCFNLAVEKAGPVPEGMHRGVALFASFGSLVTEVADITVTDGRVRVHRVTAAVDCGPVIHPDTIRAQIQSGVGMGISSMYESISFKDGAAQNANYYAYPLLKLADMPEVDVHIVPSTDAVGGIGEVGLPPILGAVANAIFAATGKRIRTLPLPPTLA